MGPDDAHDGGSPAGPDRAGWPSEWPAQWPPGALAPDPGRFVPAEPGLAVRWATSGRAALAAGVLALALAGALLVTVLGGPTSGDGGVPLPDPVASASLLGPETTPTAAGSPAPEVGASATAAFGSIRIYVLGQVRHPGVVSLGPGARVEDAVQAAGGTTEKADLTVVNLARPIADGEQLYVPRPGEEIPVADPGPAGGAAPAGAGSAGPSTPGPGVPVNLNTATVAELDALPGVGPVIAGRIVAWRQENGRFTTVDDLTEVSGIGDATMARLRPLVRV